MLKGQYLNPKYARRRKVRRRVTVVLCTTVLALGCLVAIYRIDSNIRSTMLPQAPPVAELRKQEPMRYELELFGRQYSFSTQWVYSLGNELGGVLRTPPPAVRAYYQLRAYLTDKLPKNARDNPRDSTGV